jgi:hypothetical protein
VRNAQFIADGMPLDEAAVAHASLKSSGPGVPAAIMPTVGI